jgi:hypothetical protein
VCRDLGCYPRIVLIGGWRLISAITPRLIIGVSVIFGPWGRGEIAASMNFVDSLSSLELFLAPVQSFQVELLLSNTLTSSKQLAHHHRTWSRVIKPQLNLNQQTQGHQHPDKVAPPCPRESSAHTALMSTLSLDGLALMEGKTHLVIFPVVYSLEHMESVECSNYSTSTTSRRLGSFLATVLRPFPKSAPWYETQAMKLVSTVGQDEY